MVESMQNCRSIDLSYCPNVTDKGLSYLKPVRQVKLSDNDKITGLKHLINIHNSNIRYCKNISTEDKSFL